MEKILLFKFIVNDFNIEMHCEIFIIEIHCNLFHFKIHWRLFLDKNTQFPLEKKLELSLTLEVIV